MGLAAQSTSFVPIFFLFFFFPRSFLSFKVETERHTNLTANELHYSPTIFLDRDKVLLVLSQDIGELVVWHCSNTSEERRFKAICCIRWWREAEGVGV